MNRINDRIRLCLVKNLRIIKNGVFVIKAHKKIEKRI